MSRAACSAALFLAIAASATVAAADEEVGVRVVLLEEPEQRPPAEEVRSILAEQLDPLDVSVELKQVEQRPASGDELEELALEAGSERPGTLALIAWSCGGDGCTLRVVDARSGARSAIPVEPGKASGDDLSFALASTAREAIIGSLVPELGRLAAEGERPTPPPPTGERMPQPYAPDDGSGVPGPRPWLWLEGGYHGEHPYPQPRPLHGAWIGLAMAVSRTVIPVVGVGWFGVQEGVDELGVVRYHGIPIELGLRIAFAVGPATFALAPVGRLDVLFVTVDPAGPRGSETQVELELHLGAKTTWNLPLPGGIEALLGAGILGTARGRDYEVQGTVAIPASTLRFGWWVGVAWSPLK